MTKIEKINKQLKKVKDEGDSVDFSVLVEKVDSEMRYGLAQAYGLSGWRKYMENKFRIAIINSAIYSVDLTDMTYWKSVAINLKSILNLAKEAYNDTQNIEQLTNKKNADSKKV